VIPEEQEPSTASSRTRVPGSELPEGWEGPRLNDGLVLNAQSGFACGTNNRAGDGVAHLRPMNVSAAGDIRLVDLKYVPMAEVDREERWIRLDDVLFNNTNSPELVGKTAHYDLPVSRAFSNHMTRLRCRSEVIDPRFCALALHQKWREGYFRGICNNHVSQASISRSVLLETSIPLPPLAEQRRIVDQVSVLTKRVSSAHERLASISLILKRFRQSVLAAACSGRLTAGWRAAQITAQPAKELVEEIYQHRARRSITASNDGQRTAGTRKRSSKYTSAPSIATDRSLPTGWCLARIGDISDCLDSQRIPINRDARALRMGDVPYYGANGQVGWIDTYLFDEELVLVVEDETFVGRDKPFSYVIRGKSWVNNHAHVLRPLGGMSADHL
jgi:hypothetical protein